MSGVAKSGLAPQGDFGAHSDSSTPAAASPTTTALIAPGTPAPLIFDPETDAEPRLPSDHPAWARDVVSLSHRARELLVRLRPVAVLVFSAWEHRLRSIFILGQRLSIDVSGCYRLD